MRPHDPCDGRPRRRSRSSPVLERLEPRELLSAVATSSAPHPSTASAYLSLVKKELAAERGQTAGSASQGHPDSPNGLIGRNLSPGPFLNPAVIHRVANELYPAGSATGTPTPREIRRQTFTGRWTGQYTVGPPTFSDRASTIHLYGKTGGSNQFLKGKFNMTLFPPGDPDAIPNPGNPFANQVTGIAGLFNQNLLQSGGVVVLDLNGAVRPGSNPLALPTHLTWTYDSNASAGPYAAPVGFTQGAGTLDIDWIPDAHPHPGTIGSGHVIVTFQGLINTSQLVSPISKFIS